MAFRILKNTREYVQLHATGNSTLVVAGNSSVSNIALPTQVLTGATITQMNFGSPSGNGAYWSVLRGANVAFAPDSTAYLDLRGVGMPYTLDASADLTCNLIRAAAGEGFILIELHKKFNVPDDSTY